MKESVFSFFNAPITNQVPNGVVCAHQLHAYITSSEWLRERTGQVRAAAGDEKRFRRMKQGLLPYVTPAGVFSYRKEERLLLPSGEFVVDIDHLSSPEEATRWRDTLAADGRLCPDLSFVSPSGMGVKLLIPYRLPAGKTVKGAFDEAVRSAWEYLEWRYGLKADTTNADLSRACFLCFDPAAKLGG
ncbi:BT4734/BF3469 family protein [uncultured Parabacteroides sp.]|uniref:BT4734/BF3469 family protein n=1 Tax=uncultured Parabacteroides sp. TaxID=512312 RepID=UPI0026039D5E|nr:BT4734/BF3469 family protein [uncultured Parabacteroides sp.]